MPAGRLAAAAGIGLRAPHYAALLERRPPLGFLEVHSENYFGAGGEPLAVLEDLRRDYAVSLHGVGLSLGSADRLDAVQERLGRRILIENVSTYLEFAESGIAEWDFLAEAARRSGCGVLLDVNNIWVNAVNHRFDARAYLEAIDPATVGEIHLAGFEAHGARLIDTHGARVNEKVWDLYGEAIRRFGARPTLLEWDADIPPLDVLLEEAARADALVARSSRSGIPAQALP